MTKHLGKRLLLIGVVSVAGIVLLYGLFIAYFYLIAPLTTGFQAYAPTMLPTGVRVTGHTTQQYLYYGDRIVNIGTSVPSFYISENKASDNESANIYSCISTIYVQQSTCTIHRSPKGQRYDILTEGDASGNILLDTISWTKGNTLMLITIEDMAATRYANANWGNIIDSFIPTSYGYGRGSVIQRSYD